eukprot:scaffold2607_cov254-Pinguiococcus_pyrenoidosus.AAC.7
MIDVVRRRLALCRSLLEESDGLRWILDNHLPQAIHFNVPMPASREAVRALREDRREESRFDMYDNVSSPILDLEPAPRSGVCFIQQVENLLVVNLEERQAKSDLVLVLPLCSRTAFPKGYHSISTLPLANVALCCTLLHSILPRLVPKVANMSSRALGSRPGAPLRPSMVYVLPELVIP